MSRIGLQIALVTCTCTLLIGGCMHTSKADFPQHYTLTATAPAGPHNQTADHSGGTLAITRIAVPQWLQGTSMYYRLDYQDNARISAYGQSDWVAPPATLLEHIVQEAITAGGGWRAVTGPDTPASADVSLHIRLDDFSQAFARPDESAGVLDATATLIDNQHDRVFAQKHFHIQVTAPSADAAGGVTSMSQASGKFAAQLQRWLHTATAHVSQPADESR